MATHPDDRAAAESLGLAMAAERAMGAQQAERDAEKAERIEAEVLAFTAAAERDKRDMGITPERIDAQQEERDVGSTPERRKDPAMYIYRVETTRPGAPGMTVVAGRNLGYVYRAMTAKFDEQLGGKAPNITKIERLERVAYVL